MELSKAERRDDIWEVIGTKDNSGWYGFCRAYNLPSELNLRSISKELKEGTVICDPQVIAGKEHVYEILAQALEYWNRGLIVARNRSIDLLLRITGQTQIAEAIRLSKIEKNSNVVFFGLVQNKGEAIECLELFERLLGPGLVRNDSLIQLDRRKELVLKKMHNIPSAFPRQKIPALLQERAILLSFER